MRFASLTVLRFLSVGWRSRVRSSAITLCGCVSLAAQAPWPNGLAHLAVDPSQIVSPVSPTLYGMMTEEINHAFDGGLYAELVQNRTFRGSWQGIEHWTLVRDGEARASM